MENNYEKLARNIHAPERLKDRVLCAARRERSVPRGRTKRKWTPALRGMVCAVCALALVLGSVTLRRSGMPGEVTLTYEFGLAASAADELPGVNGGIVFRWVENCGHFRITGEGIETISLSTDRGQLWRAGINLGSSVKEAFDPSAVYGLAPADGYMQTLDGSVLTLTAVFSDGTEKRSDYRLSLENLRTFQNEDGTELLVPGLAGDDEADSVGVYAVSEEDSRWFQWPVAGSSIVSLSAPYGLREGTDYFHAGIDIPGERGMEIEAAMAGTVTETGFDPERGNYLLLDHGGGLTTLYGQCQEILVEEGTAVESGAAVALLGSTGTATGPHLHFEVRQDGQAQNPVAYFDSTIRDTLHMG